MNRRPARRPRLGAFAALFLVGLVAACAEAPSPSATSAPVGSRPGILIDQTWGSLNGDWTFTGQVDPDGDPTDVILEVGPGPATARRFDTSLPVADDLIDAGPITITTRDIPDIEEICVRFTATNSAGTSSSSPLCFPHDLPSFAPPGAPAVFGAEEYTVEAGAYTFAVRVDPEGSPTDVVLEIGAGPSPGSAFEPVVEAGQDLLDAVTLEVTTSEVPASGEVCARFTATNAVGTASTTPICFTVGG